MPESSVINEYLEETFPDPPMFPADPYRKALSRILIDYCNTSFTTNMYRLLMEQDAARRPRIEAAANKDWNWLDDMLMRLGPDQDFPFGRFGMAELTYAPFLEQSTCPSLGPSYRTQQPRSENCCWRPSGAEDGWSPVRSLGSK